MQKLTFGLQWNGHFQKSAKVLHSGFFSAYQLRYVSMQDSQSFTLISLEMTDLHIAKVKIWHVENANFLEFSPAALSIRSSQGEGQTVKGARPQLSRWVLCIQLKVLILGGRVCHFCSVDFDLLIHWSLYVQGMEYQKILEVDGVGQHGEGISIREADLAKANISGSACRSWAWYNSGIELSIQNFNAIRRHRARLTSESKKRYRTDRLNRLGLTSALADWHTDKDGQQLSIHILP